MSTSSTPLIHETAIISPLSDIADDVRVGPYTIIEDNVKIGSGSVIGPHCHIRSFTEMGERVTVHHGAVIGDYPQDHGFNPDDDISYTVIGDECVIREYVTIHRGTKKQDNITRIGNQVMLMGFVHIAHDCQIDDNVTICNMSMIGGHVHVARKAFLSVNSSVHQFVQIGEFVMVGADCKIVQDIPPYCLVSDGNLIYGPNTVGLKRGGFDLEARKDIKQAIKYLFFNNMNREDALSAIQSEFGEKDHIKRFTEFVEASKRGIVSPNK